MKAIIVSPAASGTTLGNAITADRWAKIFRALGHEVAVANEWSGERCDLLLALHARRSHPSVSRFHEAYPGRPLIVALTGTDLYNDLPSSREARQSLDSATRIVVLQGAASELLTRDVCAKTSIIYQSAVAPLQRRESSEGRFDVCVLSHLRGVKDPLRAAFASRLLPDASRVRIIHAGRALDANWEEAARREERRNARYKWIGEQPHETAMEILAGCDLFVLSSTAEGGANAIAEAVICGVPVLCSDIPGNVGMLEPKYPGFFGAGDTDRLAELLNRAENDSSFVNELSEIGRTMRRRFSPEQELKCWKDLLQGLDSREFSFRKQ